MIKCDQRAKVRCPFKNPCCGDETAYFMEGSECDEFNQKILAPPPTNADRIRAMSDKELADFLPSIAFEGDMLWADQFIEKLCKSCPTITCTVYGDHCQVELKECDFVDGKCPHGSEVMWWLQQPAEEANNG